MGVKSLWSLLTPVGRPVMLENMEGKTVAIDSSIWIYQFQATMRGKDGNILANAHVLGFLRRLCKLLFYGMRPVFVFDGGAPALKRETLNERRRKKSGAAATHAKVAERLLAAQMRREALKHVKSGQASRKGKEKAVDEEETVFLEDIDPRMPQTSPKKNQDATPNSSPKKSKFYDHDPYRLPDVDMEARVANATRATAPDPRLATEDELRDFIENMKPEDFDVTSAAFQELPTEVQYEIVGDLRLKSRQTSYTRLQQMLKNAPTPLDFSKQQIKNLQQRNSLTQQLLTTTDTIGKAHIEIPVRIASERNREYVLLKNEDSSLGWILGIRDEGTEQKPILLDHDDEEVKPADSDEDDEDMEEVDIPCEVNIDPDLREYQRTNALAGIAPRTAISQSRPEQHDIGSKGRGAGPTIPLFTQDEDDDLPRVEDEWEEDEELAMAIQASLDHARSRTQFSPAKPINPSSGNLETALSIANAGPSQLKPTIPTTLATASSSSDSFGTPFLLNNPIDLIPEVLVPSVSTANIEPEAVDIGPDITLSTGPGTMSSPPSRVPSPSGDLLKVTTVASPMPPSPSSQSLNGSDVEANSDLDMEEIVPLPSLKETAVLDLLDEPQHDDRSNEIHKVDDLSTSEISAEPRSYGVVSSGYSVPLQSNATDLSPFTTHSSPLEEDVISVPLSPPLDVPVPSPSIINSATSLDVQEPQEQPRPPSPEVEDWDAAQEMDPVAEEGEFARFMSQVKGRDINDVQREIDQEISSLNEQRKNAMRDSEDISQQMITQIMMMLRLFGIPYITAPMEAEAQCAVLASLGLVDGIITDDSDVFLFGGQRVYKNMFNQSKTVECFLLSDLARELGLDQGTLIRLAYLLGSDYVDGLPGVGPVVAMELLNEFPGDDGLHKFKDWWTKVQTGKDREMDNTSAFRKRFKKKFKQLYLPPEWPNSAVRDAYYHPTVDESEEPFKWGLPDLDALREFLKVELGWEQLKVDDLLLPIIQKMNKRSQTAAVNRQGNLNEFLDVSGGSGTLAPRKRQAYASKRLQAVVSDYRKKRKIAMSAPGSDDDDVSEPEDDNPQTSGKKASSSKASSRPAKQKRGGAQGSSSRGTSRAKSRVTKPGPRATSHAVPSGNDDLEEDGDEFIAPTGAVGEEPPPLAVNLRPRPKPKPAYRTVQKEAI